MDATIPCTCPGTPHESDRITFRDRLDFRGASAVNNSLSVAKTTDPDVSTAEILALLTEGYLLFGIEAWTRVDAKGPIEPTKAAIRQFLDEHTEEAMAAGDVADALYYEQVMLPLLQRASKSSPPSPTADSTPPPTGSQGSPRKPSKRSSITTIPTAATETTSSSLDGDSSLSPNSVSAA